jgi:hypothetical protein
MVLLKPIRRSDAKSMSIMMVSGIDERYPSQSSERATNTGSQLRDNARINNESGGVLA